MAQTKIKSNAKEQIMNQGKMAGSAAVLDQVEDLTQALEGMKGALDALGTNVFVADRELRLVYMNARANDIMSSMGPTIEKLFGISYRDLIGTKIDAFHGNRTRARQPAHPHGDPIGGPHSRPQRERDPESGGRIHRFGGQLGGNQREKEA
jgi:hypothetical protein